MIIINTNFYTKLLDNIDDSVIITDKNFVIKNINKHALKMFDIDIGSYFDVKKYSIDFSLHKQSILYNEISLDLSIIRNLEYNIYVFIFKDISLVKKLKNMLKCYEYACDKVNESIILSDHKGKMFFFNNSAEELEGLSREYVLGKTSSEIYNRPPEKTIFYNVIKNRKEEQLYFDNDYTVNKTVPYNMLCDYYPILDNNELIGVCSVGKNIKRIQKLFDDTLSYIYEFGGKIDKKAHFTFNDIVGESVLIKKTISEGKNSVNNDSPVLIIGETGTGKEMFAQSIHTASKRYNKPFIPLNCAAIPETLLESALFGTVKGAFSGAENSEGLFVQAGKGTIFLDEINSMSLNLQAKLLRVIQENKIRRLGSSDLTDINCRIISAINQDPDKCISNSTLRKDLFYRLAIFSVYIPSLRKRKEDIEILAYHFINYYNNIYKTSVKNISNELINFFMSYNWPGNIRELQNLIHSSLSTIKKDSTLKPDHLSSYFYKIYINNEIKGNSFEFNNLNTFSEIISEASRQAIVKTLSHNNGNVTRSAKSLGLTRENLYYHMKKLDVNASDYKK